MLIFFSSTALESVETNVEALLITDDIIKANACCLLTGHQAVVGAAVVVSSYNSSNNSYSKLCPGCPNLRNWGKPKLTKIYDCSKLLTRENLWPFLQVPLSIVVVAARCFSVVIYRGFAIYFILALFIRLHLFRCSNYLWLHY